MCGIIGIASNKSVSSNIIHTDQILQVNVTTDFESDDVMIITGARIQMTDETASDVFLTLQVNSNGPDDAVMPAAHYIRIGQPQIYSTGNHVFLAGDSDGRATEKIIIKDNIPEQHRW